MNFCLLKNLTIPEGRVKKISDTTGRVLWNSVVPTAILYGDGTLIFQNDATVDDIHGEVINTYTGWNDVNYSEATEVPWYNDRASITSVLFKSGVSAISTSY